MGYWHIAYLTHNTHYVSVSLAGTYLYLLSIDSKINMPFAERACPETERGVIPPLLPPNTKVIFIVQQKFVKRCVVNIGKL